MEFVVFRVNSYGRVCRFDIVTIKVVEFGRYPFYLWRVGVLSCRCHLVSQSVVKVAICCPCFSILKMNKVTHFAIMCINALPPASLGSCSVDSGTLKIAPFHMNHCIAVFICLTLSVGGGKI